MDTRLPILHDSVTRALDQIQTMTIDHPEQWIPKFEQRYQCKIAKEIAPTETAGYLVEVPTHVEFNNCPAMVAFLLQWA